MILSHSRMKLCEKKEQEFIDKINEILDKTDFLLLNTSCNTENTSYAAETAPCHASGIRGSVWRRAMWMKAMVWS